MPVLIWTGPRVTRPFVCSQALAAAMSTQADAVGGHGLVSVSYVGVGASVGLDVSVDPGLTRSADDALGAAGAVAATGSVSAPVESPAFATITAVVAMAAVTITIAATASLAFPRRNRVSSR
jgi:hypothetical protein